VADREHVTYTAEVRQQADAIRWAFLPRPGDEVAGTCLLRPIEGAQGAWLAHRNHDGATCVTRVFPIDRLEEPDALNRFVIGLRTMRLLHRAAVPSSRVIGVQRVDESLLAFSMPLIRGGDLGRSPHRFWRPRKRLDFLSSLVEAVAHVHGAGQVHGALRPSNVLLPRSGSPMLSDFGAPGAADQVSRWVFAPPELRVPGRAPTPQGDVFALGQVVCMVLCGLAPGPTLVSDIAAVNVLKLPRKLKEVVQRSTSPDVAVRYQTAGEMLARLRAGSGRWAAVKLSQAGLEP